MVLLFFSPLATDNVVEIMPVKTSTSPVSTCSSCSSSFSVSSSCSDCWNEPRLSSHKPKAHRGNRPSRWRSVRFDPLPSIITDEDSISTRRQDSSLAQEVPTNVLWYLQEDYARFKSELVDDAKEILRRSKRLRSRTTSCARDEIEEQHLAKAQASVAWRSRFCSIRNVLDDILLTTTRSSGSEYSDQDDNDESPDKVHMNHGGPSHKEHDWQQKSSLPPCWSYTLTDCLDELIGLERIVFKNLRQDKRCRRDRLYTALASIQGSPTSLPYCGGTDDDQKVRAVQLLSECDGEFKASLIQSVSERMSRPSRVMAQYLAELVADESASIYEQGNARKKQ